MGLKKVCFMSMIKPVAMQVASVVVNNKEDKILLLDEDELFNREREAFINLAKTQPTLDRISALIEKGINLRN